MPVFRVKISRAIRGAASSVTDNTFLTIFLLCYDHLAKLLISRDHTQIIQVKETQRVEQGVSLDKTFACPLKSLTRPFKFIKKPIYCLSKV